MINSTGSAEPPAPQLPKLRVERKPWNLARIASRFLSGVREVDAQREPFAQYWDRHNRAAIEQNGPLWVALGDSATQGVGASSPEKGWVPNVLNRLRAEFGPSWRVINLSMTGARMLHVTRDQIPLIERFSLEPVFVTCMIGTNDFIAGARAETIRSDAERLVTDLPEGTLLGKIAGPGGRSRNRAIREPFFAAADEGKIVLFEPYRWPERQNTLAADRFHPGDRGYEFIADGAWAAIEPLVRGEG